jgi:hypothetical protein
VGKTRPEKVGVKRRLVVWGRGSRRTSGPPDCENCCHERESVEQSHYLREAPDPPLWCEALAEQCRLFLNRRTCCQRGGSGGTADVRRLEILSRIKPLARHALGEMMIPPVYPPFSRHHVEHHWPKTFPLLDRKGRERQRPSPERAETRRGSDARRKLPCVRA